MRRFFVVMILISCSTGGRTEGKKKGCHWTTNHSNTHRGMVSNIRYEKQKSSCLV